MGQLTLSPITPTSSPLPHSKSISRSELQKQSRSWGLSSTKMMKPCSGPALTQAVRELEKNDASHIKSKQKRRRVAWAPKFKPRPSNNSKTASNWGTMNHYVTRRLLYLFHWQTFPAWFCINMGAEFPSNRILYGASYHYPVSSEGWPHCFSTSLLPLTPDTLVNWLHLGMRG